MITSINRHVYGHAQEFFWYIIDLTVILALKRISCFLIFPMNPIGFPARTKAFRWAALQVAMPWVTSSKIIGIFRVKAWKFRWFLDCCRKKSRDLRWFQHGWAEFDGISKVCDIIRNILGVQLSKGRCHVWKMWIKPPVEKIKSNKIGGENLWECPPCFFAKKKSIQRHVEITRGRPGSGAIWYFMMFHARFRWGRSRWYDWYVWCIIFEAT